MRTSRSSDPARVPTAAEPNAVDRRGEPGIRPRTRRIGRRLGPIVWLLAVLGGTVAGAIDAEAALRITVDLSDQRMYVRDGSSRRVWPVSTGRAGFRTPTGAFRPIRLERTWFSRKYDDAPMPHAIFFRGGYAIHGTTEIRSLGRAASHGCVRLSPRNARRLFSLVLFHGAADTTIRIKP